MISLNDREMAVLEALADSSGGNGHDFGFTDEVDFESLGLSARQYAGYVSSLSKKGCFSAFVDLSCDPHIECNSVQFSFSDEAFEILGLLDEVGR